MIKPDIQQKVKQELEKYPNIKFIAEGNPRLYESLNH
jgi:precorrin-2 methylase